MNTKAKPPNVVNVGKRKQKDIKKLKKGEGPLMEDVLAAVARAQVSAAEGKELVPVVIVYQKKMRRKKRGMAMMGPFF